MKRFIAIILVAALLCLCACAPAGNSGDAGQPAATDQPAVENDAATPEAQPSAQKDSGRVEYLRLAGGTDWGAPSPFLHSSRGPGSAKMHLVFASLLEADEKGVVGWMAKDWAVEGDEYTFTLWENAQFHDGHPLTTADVAFTIDYYRQFAPVNNTLGAGDKFLIESYEIVDEQTIVLTAKEQVATTLVNLGAFEILPKHIWEKVEDPLTYNQPDAFIGSGAYVLTTYDGATGSYEFTAFDGFCAGSAAANRVLFVPVSDELLAFEANEIDITGMPADLSDKYMSDDSIGLVAKDNDMGYKLLINFEQLPEFLELGMRSALYSALDRQAVVDKVFRGVGSVGSAGYAPSGSIYYNEDCVQYPYDPQAALAVLGEKGLKVTMIAANSGSDVKIAELIKLDLEAAGMEVTVSAFDSAVRDDMVNAGEYQLALVGNGGWGGKAPDYLRTIFSDLSKNTGGSPHTMGPIGYESAAITQLAEDQRAETDFDKRVELLKQLQYEISKEIPLVVIATQSSYSIYRKAWYDGWMKTYDYQQAEQNRLSYMMR